MSFVHLHVHTEYSKLDGMGKIAELVSRAKELGQVAVAITDHGNLFGSYHLYKECKSQGIQPIYGIEFYHRVPGIDKRLHLVAFAKSMKGLMNLYKLHEIAHRNKDGQHPLITYDDLFLYRDDLIITSACLGGHIPQLLLQGKFIEARQVAMDFKATYGDDFYLEIQPNSIPEQEPINNHIYDLAIQLDIKVVATNDVHYILKEDAGIHEMLLCMQTQSAMSNPNRFKFSVNDFWLKSEEEMMEGFRYLPEEMARQALANTLEIAEKCNFEYELPTDCLPKFSDDEDTLLREQVNIGWRGKRHNGSKVEVDRAKFELEVIKDKGYSGYFLIVADYINWAIDNGIIVGPGRGSGAGSFVGYLIGMTNLNPIDNGLLFERFLNPERKSSPDFDVDFSDRDAVVQYLRERWGEENVSAIIAYGKLTAKAVIRKVLGIHEFSQAQINEISKSLPKKLDLTLAECEQSDVFKKYKQAYPELFNAMYRLEGTIDHYSTHAAGILITPRPICEYVPTGYDDKNGILVSGFDKYTLEEVGLYKFDILKLVTLNVIDDTLRLIKENSGDVIDLEDIDYNDSAVYSDLSNGNVFGVFQLEDQADITKRLAPRNFSNLTALEAQIRPGVGDINEYLARKEGKPYPQFGVGEKSYMDETLGVITFQEQIMLRVHTLAGWSLGKGDSLRKVKKISQDETLRNDFISNCTLEYEEATQAWQEVCEALEGGYSFNKSHAASYAKISFQTAWLKHYYPKEFMCALMTWEATDQAKVAERINQCKSMGIPILPPDINISTNTYQYEPDGIRFAINTIKGVGENALEQIFAIRPVVGLEDFYNRVNKQVVKKNVAENLIKAGCFDFENPDRYEMLALYYELRKDKKIAQAYRETRYDVNVRTIFEKETLGLYLTAHPMDRFNFRPLRDFPDQSPALVGGEITEVKTIFDKNNDKMAFVTLSTKHGNNRLVVFSSTYVKVQEELVVGNFIMVKGKRDGGNVLVNEINRLEVI